jgi:hypothetical protein
MPISTVDRESVRLKKKAAFIRTSEGETENGATDISGGGVILDDELLSCVAMKARSLIDISSFASLSHL